MKRLNVKDLEQAVSNVIVLSYDLDTPEISNLNDFIKQTLLADGWQDKIGNVIVRQLFYRDISQKKQASVFHFMEGRMYSCSGN